MHWMVKHVHTFLGDEMASLFLYQKPCGLLGTYQCLGRTQCLLRPEHGDGMLVLEQINLSGRERMHAQFPRTLDEKLVNKQQSYR